MTQTFDTSGIQQRVTTQQIVAIISDVDVVLIGGCGGSGKTTLAKRIAELANATVVHLDDFAQPDLPGWDEQRFDEQVMIPLSTRGKARYQRYDWDKRCLSEWHDVEPNRLLIAEGVQALDVETHGLEALRIWVDAPYSTRLNRGVERDGEEMRSTWTDVWMPAESAYAIACEPWLSADFVIDGTQAYE